MSAAMPMDLDRRVWITATTVVGGAGLLASAVPFVASMAPSERVRALGAPVEVELQGIEPGDIRTVEWRGTVPPYRFASDSTLLICADAKT